MSDVIEPVDEDCAPDALYCDDTPEVDPLESALTEMGPGVIDDLVSSAVEVIETVAAEQAGAEEPVIGEPIEEGPEPGPDTAGILAPPAPDDFVLDEHGVYGDPASETEYWFDAVDDSAVMVSSVAQIVSEFTGEPMADETAVVARAVELGVITDNGDGTYSELDVEGARAVLDSYGVASDIYSGSVSDLAYYLDQGHDIVVSVVDVNGETQGALLTGIDMEEGVAFFSDATNPDSPISAFALDVLASAWEDAGNLMLVTQEPAPVDDTAAAPVVVEEGEEVDPVTFASQLEEAESVVAEPVVAAVVTESGEPVVSEETEASAETAEETAETVTAEEAATVDDDEGWSGLKKLGVAAAVMLPLSVGGGIVGVKKWRAA